MANNKKTQAMINRWMKKLVKSYVKARYPKGIEGERVYLSLAVVKEPKDKDVSYFFYNEYDTGIGTGYDIDYPIEYFGKIGKEEFNANKRDR